MKLWAVSLLLVALANVALCQGQSARPAFEVASIKPSDPNPDNTIWIGMEANAGTVRYTNITLRDCIRAAYRVRDFQIQGPDWIRDARYEITAKLGAGTQDQIPEMLQSLLEERFKLSIRRGTKDQAVNVLVFGQGRSRSESRGVRRLQQTGDGLGTRWKAKAGDVVSNAAFRH